MSFVYLESYHILCFSLAVKVSLNASSYETPEEDSSGAGAQLPIWISFDGQFERPVVVHIETCDNTAFGMETESMIFFFTSHWCFLIRWL